LASLVPPFRLRTVELCGSDSVVVTTTWHHIILGGWSLGLLLSEELLLIRMIGGVDNQTPSSEPGTTALFESAYRAPSRLRNYYTWLSEHSIDASYVEVERIFTGFEPVEYPWANPNQGTTHASPASVDIVVEVETSSRIRASSQQSRITLAKTLQQCFGSMLMVVTERQDVAFGNVVSGRDSVASEVDGIERLVGMFVNTMLVRSIISKSSVHVRSGSSDFISINRAMQITKQTSLPVMAVQNFEGGSDTSSSSSRVLAGRGSVDLDSVSQWMLGDEIVFSTSGQAGAVMSLTSALYRTLQQFKHEEVLPFYDRYSYKCHTQAQLLQDSIGLSTSEKLDRHQEQIRFVEDEDTVSSSHVSLSINEMTARLATIGVVCGSTVAFVLDRSVELMTSIMAATRLGATVYVVDYRQPEARISELLELSGASAVVTSGMRFDSVARSCLDVRLGSLSRLRNTPSPSFHYIARETLPQYAIIFTSGSTGRPKGTVLNQFGWQVRIHDTINAASLGRYDFLLGISLPSFDAFHWEFLESCLTGASLVVISLKHAADSLYRNVLTRTFEVRYVPLAVPSIAASWFETQCDTVEVLQIG